MRAETEGELPGETPQEHPLFSGSIKEACWSLLEDTAQDGLCMTYCGFCMFLLHKRPVHF